MEKIIFIQIMAHQDAHDSNIESRCDDGSIIELVNAFRGQGLPVKALYFAICHLVVYLWQR